MSNSVIRWAGSKKKLLPALLEEMPDSFNRYVEPFCGSASLFFKLGTKKAILSDINQDLINAWSFIKNDPSIRNDLVTLPKTKEFYYEMRSRNEEEMNPRERAIRFLYLNRFCFNGVYRTNKSGKFNVPLGSRTGDFPSQEAFSHARKCLSAAELHCNDYKETLKKLQDGDFLYIDPPYQASNKFTGEYGVGSFSSNEMPAMIDTLNNLSKKGVKFILSYKAEEGVIDRLEKHFFVKKINVKRHVQGFKTAWGEAEEIIVRNYERK